MFRQLRDLLRPRYVEPKREHIAPCPRCGANVLESGRFVGGTDGLSSLECPCGLISRWDMRAAVPLLVRH